MNKTEIARQYVEKYIEIAKKNNKGFSKRWIAKVMFEENPDIFKDYESARSYLRASLGVMGKNKGKNADEINRRFSFIMDSVDELDYKEFIVPKVYNKTLVLSDIHSRFCDKNALEKAINYGIKSKCNSVIINGDMLDFYQHSKFDKNPNILQYFEDEREWAQDFLELLQDTFGYVVYKLGNHELRRENKINSMALQMPEILNIANIKDYVFFDNSNVQVVEDYNHIQYGKLNIIHGHEYYGGGGIHVAYNRLNKAMDNVLSGHSHVSQTSTKMTINGQVYGSWSLGCLCNLHPRYNPKNNWTQGFAILEKESDGNFEVVNKMILGNKVISI